MLRNIALVAGLMCLTSSASAQVQQGSFKFGIDTNLFRYSTFTVEDSVGGEDVESTQSTVAFGPTEPLLFASPLPGHVGLAFGYVAHPHVIPQLHFSFSRTTSDEEVEGGGQSDSEDGPTVGALMLRPELEIPFNPDSRVVGYGLAGFDFRHIKQSEEDNDGGDDDEVVFKGYGPVLGLGLHMFVVPQASIDLGAQFSYLAMSGEQDGEDFEGDLSSLSFGITAGVTVWP